MRVDTELARQHRAKVTGSKQCGYRAVCDCGWQHLGTYVLRREGMQREVALHRLQVERRGVFDALDAGVIDVDEWTVRMADVERRLALV